MAALAVSLLLVLLLLGGLVALMHFLDDEGGDF